MSYNLKSCNSLQKPYYYPIEAAIRWCGLTEFEVQIMDACEANYSQLSRKLPQWPCLSANLLKIVDATSQGELIYDLDGLSIGNYSGYIEPTERTIRHSVLKNWMIKYYPDQKPEFLFDESELQSEYVDSGSLHALELELNNTKEQLENANKQILLLENQCDEIKAEFDLFKQSHQIATKKPDYMNFDHPHFSKELCDAVTAWSLTVKKDPEPQRFRALAKAWLSDSGGYEGDALERLATVANSDKGKRGGVPKKDP